MYITIQDVEYLLRFAIISTAEKLGIEYSVFGNYPNIVENIKRKDKELGESLQLFMKAYIEWFQYTASDHQSYSSQKHNDLMNNRDETRNRFLELLNR